MLTAHYTTWLHLTMARILTALSKVLPSEAVTKVFIVTTRRLRLLVNVLSNRITDTAYNVVVLHHLRFPIAGSRTIILMGCILARVPHWLIGALLSATIHGEFATIVQDILS